MSALRQLQLIIVGATIGVIGGSIALRTSDDFRPVANTAIAGVVLLGLSFVLQRFASQVVPRLAPAYASLIGRVVVTAAAALSVGLVFNVLVAPDARTVPARTNAEATVGPAPTAPSKTAAPIAPASSADPVVPVVPASPQPAVRPPAATPTTSLAPRATVMPASSPPATPPVSAFATPAASPPSPSLSSPATSSPAQSVATATPQPTPIRTPASIIPTLPPLPTIRLP